MQDDKTIEMTVKLNKSMEKIATDKIRRQVIGATAVNDYYDHFKIISRVKEENQLNMQEPSAFTALLTKSI